MKVKEITLREAVKVTNVDTSTGNVTYKDDVTGVETTVPKGMATPAGQGQVQISAQQVAPGEAGAEQAPTIKVGDQVDIVGQTGQTQTMGSMEEDSDDDYYEPYNGEDDEDSEDTTSKQVRDMASWLENRWGSYEDWGREELESIADELQISVEEVADALGLDIDGYDLEVDENNAEISATPDEPPPILPSADDPQMEAIKRLAGL